MQFYILFLDLVRHLNRSCASILKNYFDYSKRRCNVCEGNDFSNIWEILHHCQFCNDWTENTIRNRRAISPEEGCEEDDDDEETAG